MAEPELHFLDCPDGGKGHRMAYWQWGDPHADHTVVCAHGLSRQGRDFDHLAKALIERAAAIMGSTVSSFMLQNAYEAASRVVANNDTLMLSQEAFEAFIAACDKPAEPTEALIKLMAQR